jgi:DNA-binding response OmpR family regulator
MSESDPRNLDPITKSPGAHRLGAGAGTADGASSSSAAVAQRSPARILIVEDDGDLLEVLKFVLEDAGYTVEGASGGDEALKLIDTEAIDLVVLDVSLAGTSGLEVARQLRANQKSADVLIALHTGLEEADVRQQFSDYDSFMPKGDDADELLRRVSDVLSRHALQPSS